RARAGRRGGGDGLRPDRGEQEERGGRSVHEGRAGRDRGVHAGGAIADAGRERRRGGGRRRVRRERGLPGGRGVPVPVASLVVGSVQREDRPRRGGGLAARRGRRHVVKRGGGSAASFLLMASASALAGCQALLDIDPDAPILPADDATYDASPAGSPPSGAAP